MIEQLAAKHTGDILQYSMAHTPDHTSLVLVDDRSELSRLLARAYKEQIPGAEVLDFYAMEPEALIAKVRTLGAKDLLVLVQSASFRMESFRIRVDAMQRDVKVVEHSNLARMTGPDAALYVDALAYDHVYYRTVGRALQARLNRTSRTVVHSGAAKPLVYDSPFEEAKLNTGDFEGLKNVASTFPIGEVFTESKDLEALNGEVRIFSFANSDYLVEMAENPITLVIEKGRVADVHDSVEGLDRVLEQIHAHEGEVWVREFGLGMNRAFSRDRSVNDVTAYERVHGVHLSLGAKHGVYKKPNLRARDARFHVDVFVDTHRVVLDEVDIYFPNEWRG
ncbi:MAG: hypothetical protein KBF88_11045 [Polyangiaceae bacterium]|nr:hypothetical protein [Polyangiaceae bacterium]